MENRDHEEMLAEMAASCLEQEDEFDRALTQVFVSGRINRAEYMSAVFAMDQAAEVGGSLVH